MRPIKQLLSKTKDLFRNRRVIEPTPPFQAPSILPLPQTTSSLQELIDEELLLLSEGNTICDANFSSPTRSEEHSSGAITSRVGLTQSPLLSAGSTGSGAHEDILARAKPSGYSKASLSAKPAEAGTKNESLGSSQQSSVDESPAASSSPFAATAETSVLVCLHPYLFWAVSNNSRNWYSVHRARLGYVSHPAKSCRAPKDQVELKVLLEKLLLAFRSTMFLRRTYPKFVWTPVARAVFWFRIPSFHLILPMPLSSTTS